jgi:hypothetical protein
MVKYWHRSRFNPAWALVLGLARIRLQNPSAQGLRKAIAFANSAIRQSFRASGEKVDTGFSLTRRDEQKAKASSNLTKRSFHDSPL